MYIYIAKCKHKTMNNKLLFHYLSYLQYPFIVGVLYFSYKLNTETYNREDIAIFEDVNSLLVLMGLAVSFATLQDTNKVSLKFEKRIWEDPKFGKILIVAITALTLLLMVFGMFGYFLSENEKLQEISIGLIVLGIGFLGFTKAVIEVSENHRKD